jgi:pimeloyl-ACP methyl ester carboxylesterase
MLSWIRLVVIAGLIAASVGGAAAKENPLERLTPVPANEPIPVVDFFRPSLFSNPEFNGAGTHFIASTTLNVDRRQFVVFDMAKGKFRGLHAAGDRDIHDVNWMGDDWLIFNLVADKKFSEGLCVVSVADFRRAHMVDFHNVVEVLSAPDASPKQPIVWIQRCAYDHGKDAGVVQIDAMLIPTNPFADQDSYTDPNSIAYGTLAKVVRSFPRITDGAVLTYFTDKQGELAFGVSVREGLYRLCRLVDAKWEISPVDLETVGVIGPGEKPGELLVLGPRETGKPRPLEFMDAATGQVGKVLLRDDQYDFNVGSVYRHPVDHRILGVRYQRGASSSVWFDPKYQALQTKIENSLRTQAAGAVVTIVGSDRAEKRYFVSIASDRRPLAYYQIDTEKGALSLLADTAPWIDPARTAPMSFIKFKSRDGIVLEGYLTLPAGATKANPVPLVVLAHGGPWVRDTWGFDREAQFLASRGYAVFQPNYRGSVGTQWRFPAEDMWAFRKMHDDVTDGLRAVLKTGLVDPTRVAIMGSSFGGYLAVCGAAYEPDLYRCAVSIAGVFDWEQQMKESRDEEYIRGRFGVLRRQLGDPKRQKEKFDEISPLRHVDQIKIPVFVAHGTSDVVANVEQSRRLIEELNKYHVPHVAHFKRGEGHGMAWLDHEVELYTAIEAFLAKNLAPRTPAPTAVAAPALPAQ